MAEIKRRALIKKPDGMEMAKSFVQKAAAQIHREVGPDPMAEYEAFRERVKIDRDQLDQSVLEQAQIFSEIGERHVRVCSLRDRAKEDLAMKDSELAREIRARLVKGGQKFTEGQINDEVILHPDRASLNDIYTGYKKAADLWGILRESFEQRMRMLRELVSLHATGYYNSSAMGHPRNQVSEAMAKSAREQQEEHRRNRA